MIDAGSELKRGLLWFGSATLLMRLLDLGSTLVILRVLTEKDMGVAALAWSVVVVCEACSGFGIGSALVQAKEVSRDALDSLFWFATGTGTLLAVAMVAIAPVMAAIYEDPALTAMVMVSALKLIFVGTALVPLQLLARDLRFRGSGVAQTGATALEAITKVALVLSGFGAWALVIANAARGLYILFFVYVLAPYWPRLRFRVADVRPFVAFGMRSMTAVVLYQAYRNADFFLVGRYLGLDVLGVYRVAFSLAMTPLEMVIGIVNRVAFPVYARISHDLGQLADVFARSVRYVLLLAGPIVVVLFFAAGDAVSLIAHERWLPAVPAIQVLLWAALLRAVSQLFAPLYQAVGRPEFAAYDALVSLITLVGGFWVALQLFGERYGMMAVCAVWLCVYPFLIGLQAYWAGRTAQVTARKLLKSALPVLGAVLVMLVAVAPLAAVIGEHIGALPRLCSLALAGLLVYGLYLRFVLGLHPRDLRASSVRGQDA